MSSAEDERFGPLMKSPTPPTIYKVRLFPPHRARRPSPKEAGNITAQRVASAKRMTIMDLKSKIKLLQDEIEKLKKENRFLNHLHHRQDNALKKWEGKDAELPKLLNQHKDEIRALQQQLRRAQQQTRDSNEKLSMRDKKIFRLEAELDKLKTLVHEEHLQDRHQLQEELDITRMNLAGAEKRIREYMKHVDILEKNHRHQLAAQERKMLKANNSSYELQQIIANLRLALRNKDRMLNYIQMRASGRNLIRAFHAEKAGAEDLLYGTSISTDLNRPFNMEPPPPTRINAQKAKSNPDLKVKSIESTNSSDLKDVDSSVDKTVVSVESDLNNHEIEAVVEEIQDNERNDLENEQGPSPQSRCPSSVMAPKTAVPMARPQPPPAKEERNADPKERFSLLNAKRPVTDVKANKPANEAENRRKAQVPTQKRIVKPINNNNEKDRKVFDAKKPFQEKKPAKAPIKCPKSFPTAMKEASSNPQLGQKSNPGNVSQAKQVRSNPSITQLKTQKQSQPNYPEQEALEDIEPPEIVLSSKKSEELIYSGSLSGFKYEGPFVNRSTASTAHSKHLKQQSTEVLFSVKSDKLSDRNMSSASSASSSFTSCSYSTKASKAPSPVRSPTGLSNIGILSTRLKESYDLLSPRNSEQYQPPLQRNEQHLYEKQNTALDLAVNILRSNQAGGGDTHGSLSSMLPQPSPLMRTSPTPNAFESLNSSYQPHSQSGSVLHVINAEGSPGPGSPHYLTSPREQTVAVPLVSVASPRSPRDPTGESSYNGHMLPHATYAHMNTVSFVSETQSNYQNNHDGQQSPSFSTDYTYYSYPPNQDGQQHLSGAAQQPNNLYDPTTQMGFPQSNYYANGNSNAQTYFHPNTNPGGNEALPSLPDSSAPQANYNPSYYVNLNSWK